MKKMLSLILAGTMVLSLSAPAFAAETANKVTANQETSNKASIDVKGTYLTELKSDEIISVVVAWEDMNFIYYGSQEGTWQPSDHTYSGEKTATWNKTASDITVTNHSNVAVTADLSYTKSVESVSGNLSSATLDLESAAKDEYMGENAEKAPTKKSTFTIDGSMDENSSKDLGTITVSLNEKDDSADGEDTDDGTEWTVVTTAAQLTDALNAGGNIRLDADITTTERLFTKTAFNLDLNEHTLQCAYLDVRVNGGSGIRIANGTIESYGSDYTSAVHIYYNSDVTIDECTLTGKNYYALYLHGASATVKNSTLNGGVDVATFSDNTSTLNSRLTATDGVVVTKIAGTYTSGIVVEKGSTATFGSNPTELLNTSYNEGEVTKNDDGTWTVS